MIKEQKKITYDIIFEYTFFILVIIAVIFSIFLKNTEGFFSSMLTLITLLLPKFILKKSRVKIPSALYFSIIFFIFLSMFLGKMNGFYVKFPWWDMMLHTLSGIILSIIGFSMYLLLNKLDLNENINPLLIACYAFFFAVAMAGMWEIFEFSSDKIFGTNAQLGSLDDTMWDIIAGTTGGFAGSLLGYLYMRGKNIKIFKQLVEYMTKENSDLIKK